MARKKVKDMSIQIEETKAPEEETQLEQAQEAATETLLKEEENVIASEAKQSDKSREENEIATSPSTSAKASADKSAPRNDEEKVDDKKTEPTKTTKGTAKPKKGKKIRSKKYQEKAEALEKTRQYPLNEAVEAAKNASYSKFVGTFELHINTNSKNIRGLITLPFASGKKLTILAFGKDASDSGADMVGDDSTIKDIREGKLGFDVVVTTPEWMPKLAKTASILGPRGLMPNPKAGTINDNLKKAVADLQGGKMEYKTEKGGQVIHLGVGKLSQPTDEIAQNIKILLTTVGKSRVKKVTLSPSMGPAVRLDLNSI